MRRRYLPRKNMLLAQTAGSGYDGSRGVRLYRRNVWTRGGRRAAGVRHSDAELQVHPQKENAARFWYHDLIRQR